jgi:hypothetical protein
MSLREGTSSDLAAGYVILCLIKNHTKDTYKEMEADPTAPLILYVVKNEWSCEVCCIKPLSLYVRLI